MNRSLFTVFRKVLLGTLIIIGASWFVSKIMMRTVQYVLLCDANRVNCKTVPAEFSYDTSDSQFIIKKLYTEDVPIVFGSTDCWVKVEGSVCMNSSTNINITGKDKVIIPLAFDERNFRWK